MKKSMIRLAFTTALGAMLMQASPVFAKTPNDQLIVATSLAQVLSLDPHQATEAKANEIMANLYDRLISVDGSGKGFPAARRALGNGREGHHLPSARSEFCLRQPGNLGRCRVFVQPAVEDEPGSRREPEARWLQCR